ncbi:MAG: helix-turn-helix transcriptional regulator [Gammaproteobacteria bacterium]|nr:helix-turn-helix transcriptional regulator [Gammaproteobacteria bacterium]MYE49768.1 helix-turn-helix transcriptional regulator [Gammaproteobacteria bacterium]
MPYIVRNRLYEEFGRRLRDLRLGRSKPMTQAGLGSLVGLSRTSITNIEMGRQQVSLHHLYRIAAALGIEPDQLLPAHSSQDVKELARELLSDKEPGLAEWTDALEIR